MDYPSLHAQAVNNKKKLNQTCMIDKGRTYMTDRGREGAGGGNTWELGEPMTILICVHRKLAFQALAPHHFDANKGWADILNTRIRYNLALLDSTVTDKNTSWSNHHLQPL